MFRKPVAAALSLVLAVSLCPTPGFADEGGCELAAGGTIAAQAATKTVWVRSQIGATTVKTYSGNLKIPATKYTYNKNGLVTKVASCWLTFDSKLGTLTTSYKYNSKGLLTKKTVTRKSDRETTKETTTCIYNSSNQLAKTKRTTNTTYDKDITSTYQYDEQGRISKKIVMNENNAVNDGVKNRVVRSKYTYSYNDAGRITQQKVDEDYNNGSKWISWGSSQTAYSYDGQGNVKSVKGAYDTTTYSYSYKSGLASTQKIKRSGGTETYKYQYKKLSVPAKYAGLVQQQQSDLLNPSATGLY